MGLTLGNKVGVGKVRQGLNTTPVVEPSPVFSSATTANFAENATGTVITAVASPVDSYSIKAGSDGDSFNINSATGAITFKNPPDYETKNSYSLTIIATKGSKTAEQTIAITITDVDESWSTAEVDQYLISLASSANTTPETIDITSHHIRSSASNAAILTLQSKNKIILVNENKSKQLILNGDFSTDQNWAVAGSSTVNTGKGRIYSPAGVLSFIRQQATSVAGGFYKLNFNIIGTPIGTAIVGNVSAHYEINSQSPADKMVYFTAVEDDLYFKRTDVCDISIDNVSLFEIGDKRLSVSGDSIATPPSWADLVRNELHYIFYSRAVASATILADLANQSTSISSDNADIIIMSLGTNDDNAGNMSTLQSTVESAIIALKSSNPNAIIYYMNVLPRWTNSAGSVIIEKQNIRSAIAAACTSQNIVCWDTITDPWILPADTTDGTHPNASGDGKIKNRIISLLA